MKTGTLDSIRGKCRVPLLLAIATLAVYFPVFRYPYVSLDDDVYVTANAWVRAPGFGWGDIAHAFGSCTAGHWHPLAMLSLKLDFLMFGADPGSSHAVNLALHLATVLVFFIAFRRMTGREAESAAVALLFAIHPLHVESVAWISERKDVLCGVFCALSVDAWGRYAEAPSRRRYLASFLFFALALLSKAMAVTLPFVLLLLDFWPLRRLGRPAPEDPRAVGISAALLEKVPFLGLSAVSSFAALAALGGVGALIGADEVAFGTRTAGALLSYAWYLGKLLVPAGLSVVYPPAVGEAQGWQVAGAALLLAVATVFSVRQSGKRPFLLFGWLWFLGTLFPVIGLVRAGAIVVADRFCYLPALGIFVAAVWGVSGILPASRRGRRVAGWIVAACLVPLAAAAHVQVRTWRDSEALFSRAIAQTRENWLAHGNLGQFLRTEGRPREAIPHLREAIRITPADAVLNQSLGLALSDVGDPAGAEASFRRAVRLVPADVEAHLHLGVCLARQGKSEDAADSFATAVRLAPEHPGARFNYGTALLESGRSEAATAQFREALRIRPAYPEAFGMLGVALADGGKRDEAARAFREALRLKPGDAAATANLARLGAAP